MEIKSNFKKGSVEMLVLALLRSGPMYGYELSQSILKLSEGIINIPEGSLYPTLYRLQDNQYVRDEKRLVGKRMSRVYYYITPEGIRRLETLLQDYALVQSGIQMILEKSKEVEKNENEESII